MGIIKTYISEEPMEVEDFLDESEETSEDVLEEVEDLIQELEEDEPDNFTERESGEDSEADTFEAGEVARSEYTGNIDGDSRVEHDAETDNTVDAEKLEGVSANVGVTDSSLATGEVPEKTTVDSSSLGYEFTPPEIPKETLTDVASLRNYAVLVTFRSSKWAGVKKDRKAVQQIRQANSAKGDIGSFDKNLLADADKPLKKIHSAIEAARTKYYERTLPWSMQGIGTPGRRQGARILPNKYFFPFAKEIATYKKEVQEALDAFVPMYPKLKLQAQSNLGDLYNEQDYPDPQVIRNHFNLDIDFAPIPEGRDLQGLPDEVLEKLSSKLNDSVRTMMQNAMDEAWSRLHKVTANIHERLIDPNKTFHKSLITNARDTCENLKYLNVAQDIRIEDLRKRVKKKLTKVEAEVIRENPEIRKRIAKDAAAILRSMEQLG